MFTDLYKIHQIVLLESVWFLNLNSKCYLCLFKVRNTLKSISYSEETIFL